jgi:3-hydroxymyristoyl/3-hydroxydecanoyl-(acyl carrier protein) dehydratase
MTHAARFTVAPDHPALPGHFPGRPVVPGVVLLDLAVEAMAGGRRAVGLPSVKFTRPVLPGQEVELRYGPAGADRLSFSCAVDGAEVARGTVVLEPAS